MIKRSRLENKRVLIFMGIFSMAVIFFCTNSSRSRIHEYSRLSVHQSAVKSAEQISSYVYYSKHIANFYEPIFKNEGIDSVLNETFEVDKIFLSFLKFEFFGFELIGVLCDENKQLICSTRDFDKPSTLSEFLVAIGVGEDCVETFYQHAEMKDSSVFRFDGNKGYSDACVVPVEGTNWNVVFIVPSLAFKAVFYRSVYEEILATGMILIMFFAYLFALRIRVKMKYREHEEREVRLEAESLHDDLTGFLNRRAFDNALNIIEGGIKLKSISFVAFDVNSLKKVNDTFGHDAGDELIKGAARCIEIVFADIGSCYRVGGDEFIVLIHQPIDDFESIMERFKKCQNSWSGELVDSLTVSVGYACAVDYENVSARELLHIADEKMYEDKRNFYNSLS